MKLPNIIHFIWIGDKKLPEDANMCIQRFKEINPDYTIMVHGEEILDDRYRKHYEAAPCLCSRSDVLRISALRRHGGWYFDCDFYPIKPMTAISDKYDVHSGGVFLTRQSGRKHWVDVGKDIANGVIGISAESRLWPVIDLLMDDAVDKPERTMFGPSMMTRLTKFFPSRCIVAERRDFYPWEYESKAAARDAIRAKACGNDAIDKVDAIMAHLWHGGGSGHIPTARRWKRSSERKRLILVGNPDWYYGNYASVVDSCDVVIRMNRCLGYGREQFRMGEKTDVWVCVSAGQPDVTHVYTRFTAVHPGGRIRKNLSSIWFPCRRGVEMPRGPDVSDKILGAAKVGDDIKIRWITSEEWDTLNKELRLYAQSFDSPSTGMAAIWMVLNSPEYDEYDKYIIGFRHQGWAGHPFKAEEFLVNELVAAGRLYRAEECTE